MAKKFVNPQHLIDKALTDFRGSQVQAGEQEVVYWCPLDKHAKPVMYMERSTGYWYCQSCGKGSRDIRKLFDAFGVELSYEDTIQSLLYSNADTTFLSKTDDFINPLTKQKLDWFEKEAKLPGPKTEAYRYLHDKLTNKAPAIGLVSPWGRELSRDEIRDNWRVWTRHPGYVFWAVYGSDGKPLFYSGRKYYAKLDPKYLHLGSKIPLVILNSLKTMRTQSGRELLFLVEGVFDAYGAPAQAIPVFGKRLSSTIRQQVIETVKANDYAVVCALDKDEIDSNLELAQTFIDNGVREVYLFKMAPAKDFGERKYVQMDRKGVLSRLTQYVGPVSKPLVRLFLNS